MTMPSEKDERSLASSFVLMPKPAITGESESVSSPTNDPAALSFEQAKLLNISLQEFEEEKQELLSKISFLEDDVKKAVSYTHLTLPTNSRV